MDSQTNPEDRRRNENTASNEEDAQILAEILEKGDWVMRLRAAGALVDLQDQRGWSFLKHALHHLKKDIRGAAIELLAEHGGPEAVDLLKISLQDEDNEIRRFAAETISSLWKDAEMDDIALQEQLQTILQGVSASRPPNTPEVERKLIRMEFAFGMLGGVATLLALGALLLGIETFRLPFIVACIAAAAAFAGNRGVERRDRPGYFLAVTGSLLLLPGVPLFTIPGLIFLFFLLKPAFMRAFGITAAPDEQAR